MYNRAGSGPINPNRVADHRGTPDDFLPGYLTAANAALDAGGQQLEDLQRSLLSSISDERNLRAAWNHLKCHGGHAPGPDGITYSDVPPERVWDFLREIRDELRSETYRPAPGRRKLSPKQRGTGQRPLWLMNLRDRVAERGAMQIVQPLLDRTFDPRSYGGRPHRSVFTALADAHAIAQSEGRLIWITQDLTNAFEHVPHERLLQILRPRLRSGPVVDLVRRFLTHEGGRGVRQGGPLSALLMNLYLDHFLDQQWRSRMGSVPLLRFIDDLLIECRDDAEAQTARQVLEQLCTSAGFRLKVAPGEDVIDLNQNGTQVTWLGQRMTYRQNQLLCLPPPLGRSRGSWLDGLRQRFAAAHEQPGAPLRAWQIFSGVVDDLGPCYQAANRRDVYSALRVAAGEAGFEEVPEFDSSLAKWQAGFARWRSERDFAFQRIAGATASNATPARRRKNLVYSQHPLTVYFDGSCVERGAGGWAYRIETSRGEFIRFRSGPVQNATNNRAELTAAIKALGSILPGTAVRLIGDSCYVVHGLAEMRRWKTNNWRKPDGRKLANADLWQELEVVASVLKLTTNWIPGHAGVVQHDACDAAATNHAKSLAQQSRFTPSGR